MSMFDRARNRPRSKAPETPLETSTAPREQRTDEEQSNRSRPPISDGDIKEQLGYDRNDPNVTVRFMTADNPANIGKLLEEIMGIGLPDRASDYRDGNEGVGFDPSTYRGDDMSITKGHGFDPSIPFDRLDPLAEEIVAEVVSAMRKHPGKQNSAHEGYAVILEELDELWTEVKKKGGGRGPEARKEAIQVAAMAMRYILDLIDTPRVQHQRF